VGGLVGGNGGEAVLERSFSKASVQGTEAAGGLAGGNTATITNCYFTGNVSGKQSVGGIAGSNGNRHSSGDYPGTISNCYVAGVIGGSQRVGGLVGDLVLGSITACFWDVDVSGLPTRMVGEAPKTTPQMQTASTFLEAGWDFVGETGNGTEEIWWIEEGKDYPRLGWELGDEASP
jgi:hypothetical protein